MEHTQITAKMLPEKGDKEGGKTVYKKGDKEA